MQNVLNIWSSTLKHRVWPSNINYNLIYDGTKITILNYNFITPTRQFPREKINYAATPRTASEFTSHQNMLIAVASNGNIQTSWNYPWKFSNTMRRKTRRVHKAAHHLLSTPCRPRAPATRTRNCPRLLVQKNPRAAGGERNGRKGKRGREDSSRRARRNSHASARSPLADDSRGISSH